jgi:TonB family protein
MHRPTRHAILHAIAVASVLIAQPRMHAEPPVEAHRAIVTRVSPVYPELAKRMGVSGSVTIRVTVLPNGTVSETRIEAGHPLLRPAAEEAVRRWRFAADPNSSDCIVSVAFELAH